MIMKRLNGYKGSFHRKTLSAPHWRDDAHHQMWWGTVGHRGMVVSLWALYWCSLALTCMYPRACMWTCESVGPHIHVHILHHKQYNRVTVILENSGLLEWMREAYHQDYVSRVRKMLITDFISLSLERRVWKSSHVCSSGRTNFKRPKGETEGFGTILSVECLAEGSQRHIPLNINRNIPT